MYAPRRKTAFVSDNLDKLVNTTTSLDGSDVSIWMSWQNLNIEARFIGPKSSQKGTYFGKTFSISTNEVWMLCMDEFVANSETCRTISNASFDIVGPMNQEPQAV